MTLKRIFFWLSGAGTEALENCPNWEQRKYVAFGATVLVPCLFAFIACNYAVSTLTDDPWIIIPVALVWSFIILCIDRALLASYRPYVGFFRKTGQFALRFLVALLLGVTIAHPLTLMLFRDTIHGEIERDREAEIERTRMNGQSAQARMEKRIEAVEQGLTEQREKLARSYEVSFLTTPEDNAGARAAAKFAAGKDAQDDLLERIAGAKAPLEQRTADLTGQIEELTPQLTTLQGELAFWQKEYEREINGQRSGFVGVGPRARSIDTDQIGWRRSEVQRLGAEVEHLTMERQRLERETAAAEENLMREFEDLQASEQSLVAEEILEQRELRRSLERDQADRFVEQQDLLRAGINQQVDLRTDELQRLQEEMALMARDQQHRIELLRGESRGDILTQTLALHQLFRKGEEGGNFALAAYLILIALFLLVDTIPLVLKFFSKAGPYDTLVEQDEVRFEKDHLAFLQNYGKYVDQLTVDGFATLTRSKPLEEALVTGVEHSRVAKTFIESLMEMERAFEERMRMEKEALAKAGGDPSVIAQRTKILEDMAESFYSDLRRRMEAFFASAPTQKIATQA